MERLLFRALRILVLIVMDFLLVVIVIDNTSFNVVSSSS